MHTLLENIVPDDGELSYRQSINAWNMIYKLMDNVKESMTHTKQHKKSIGVSDVENIVNYIKMSLGNIVKSTITPPQTNNKSNTNSARQSTQINNKEIKENKKMNKKQIVRINESQLKQIVLETMKQILNEN